MINLYKGVQKDKPRIEKPKESESSGESNPTTPHNSPPHSGHSTPAGSGQHNLSQSRSPSPEPNKANRWKYYRDIPKFTGAPGEMGATHLIKLGDMFKIFDIEVPAQPTDNAQEIINLFKTSLNGPARNWYDLNVSGENMGETTVADWETIKTKFLKYYNPA